MSLNIFKRVNVKDLVRLNVDILLHSYSHIVECFYYQELSAKEYILLIQGTEQAHTTKAVD